MIVFVMLACAPEPVLDALEPHELWKQMLALDPEQAQAQFGLLEKWAVIGDPEVSRMALVTLAHSGHPRAFDVVVHHLDGPLRLTAVRALIRFDEPRACDLLVRAWLAGPDPDPAIDAELRQALTRDRPACRSAIRTSAELRPGRMAELWWTDP